MHSGLQPAYGSPKYSGRHAQEPAPFLSLQTAFAPHGDGLQGSLGLSIGCRTEKSEDVNWEENYGRKE